MKKLLANFLKAMANFILCPVNTIQNYVNNKKLTFLGWRSDYWMDKSSHTDTKHLIALAKSDLMRSKMEENASYARIYLNDAREEIDEAIQDCQNILACDDCAKYFGARGVIGVIRWGALPVIALALLCCAIGRTVAGALGYGYFSAAEIIAYAVSIVFLGIGSALLVEKFFFQTLMRIRIAGLKNLRRKIVGDEKDTVNAIA